MSRGVVQSGVGMLELMITLLIFSIAVLGLGAVHLAAKRNTFEATQRSLATILAADILERMRSNPDVLASYALNDLGEAASGSLPPCQSESCGPEQLAANDIYQWIRLLSGHSEFAGPPGAGFISGGLHRPDACISVLGRVVTVAIVWWGMSESVNPVASSCGESGLIDGSGNRRLRVLSLTTYIGRA
jgi:type IV pilus assembly protein PilV